MDATVPVGPEPIVVSGAVGVDRPGARGLGRVGVAGGVGGPHPEGVGALGEAGEGARRGAGCQAPESSLHSNVEPASLDENEMLAIVDATRPVGPESMVVSGLWVSLVSGEQSVDPVSVNVRPSWGRKRHS